MCNHKQESKIKLFSNKLTYLIHKNTLKTFWNHPKNSKTFNNKLNKVQFSYSKITNNILTLEENQYALFKCPKQHLKHSQVSVTQTQRYRREIFHSEAMLRPGFLIVSNCRALSYTVSNSLDLPSVTEQVLQIS